MQYFVIVIIIMKIKLAIKCMNYKIIIILIIYLISKKINNLIMILN